MGAGRTDAKGRVFGRTNLLDVLRTHIQRKADGDDDLDDVQPPIATADDDYDPMDEIGNASATNMCAKTTLLAVDKTGRARYYRNRAKNCIVTVNVATRCHEVDLTCTQMRPVRMLSLIHI